jgi:hypothetical protein
MADFEKAGICLLHVFSFSLIDRSSANWFADCRAGKKLKHSSVRSHDGERAESHVLIFYLSAHAYVGGSELDGISGKSRSMHMPKVRWRVSIGWHMWKLSEAGNMTLR